MPIDKRAVVERWDAGIAATRIAEEFGVTRQRIAQIARECSKVPSGVGRLNAEERARLKIKQSIGVKAARATSQVDAAFRDRNARMLALARQGLSYSMIAERYRTTRNVVAGAVFRARRALEGAI